MKYSSVYYREIAEELRKKAKNGGSMAFSWHEIADAYEQLLSHYERIDPASDGGFNLPCSVDKIKLGLELLGEDTSKL